MAGLAPVNDTEVNNLIGTLLRQFTEVKDKVGYDNNWLASVDLKVAPYSMSPDDETLIKSAIAGLNTSLAAVDMTFINRLLGLW